MPKNPLIYYGLLVIVGTAAIYVGAWLTQKIEFILPYTLAAGIVMVIAGAFLEHKKRTAQTAQPELRSPETAQAPEAPSAETTATPSE